MILTLPPVHPASKPIGSPLMTSHFGLPTTPPPPPPLTGTCGLCSPVKHKAKRTQHRSNIGYIINPTCCNRLAMPHTTFNKTSAKNITKYCGSTSVVRRVNSSTAHLSENFRTSELSDMMHLVVRHPTC